MRECIELILSILEDVDVARWVYLRDACIDFSDIVFKNAMWTLLQGKIKRDDIFLSMTNARYWYSLV